MSAPASEHPTICDMELPADLVAELDDQALLLALDGASLNDHQVLMAEIQKRGLVV